VLAIDTPHVCMPMRQFKGIKKKTSSIEYRRSTNSNTRSSAVRLSYQHPYRYRRFSCNPNAYVMARVESYIESEVIYILLSIVLYLHLDILHLSDSSSIIVCVNKFICSYLHCICCYFGDDVRNVAFQRVHFYFHNALS